MFESLPGTKCKSWKTFGSCCRCRPLDYRHADSPAGRGLPSPVNEVPWGLPKRHLHPDRVCSTCWRGNIRLFSSQNFELNEQQHHNYKQCESHGEPNGPLQNFIWSLQNSIFRDEANGCGFAASTPFTIAQIPTMTAVQAFKHKPSGLCENTSPESSLAMRTAAAKPAKLI